MRPPASPLRQARRFAISTAMTALCAFGASVGAVEVGSARERCASLNDAGDFLAALPFCDAAVARARERPEERAALASALNGAGFALEMTGTRDAAERAYQEALAIQRALGARDQEALVLSNLAALAIGAGEYGRALAFLSDQEAVVRAAGAATWAEEELRIVRLNRGVALEQLGAYREALAELKLLAAQSEPDADHAAALQVNLAVLYRNLGDPRRALRLLDQAASTYAALGDRSALANVHLNRALALGMNLGAPNAARTELDNALALARATGDRAEQLRTLLAGGELELASGRNDAARDRFTESLDLARSSGAGAGEWAALAALGRVEHAAGRSDLALTHLREAGAILERASAGVGDSALGGALLRDQRRLYASAVDLLGAKALAGDRAAALEALAWSERWKERELLDALAGANAAPPLSAVELERLGERVGLTLAYFAGEQQLWAWQLDGAGVRMRAAGEPVRLLGQARRVRGALARGEAAEENDLRSLSTALLPHDLERGVSLRFAPDAALFYLPFALLSDPSHPQRRLVDGRAVRTTPSLSVLTRLGPGSAEPRWRFAALAAPAIAAPARGGAPAGPGGLLAARYGLPPLPGAAHEARSAALRLGRPSIVDLESDASEGRLFLRGGEGARVLHIAAHTLIDESLDEGVAIFLAPDGETETVTDGASRGDGRVTPAELARAGFAVDLVVLSGCRTAVPSGDGGGARALSSLSGALLAAGARGVMASLWEVGDAATATLMEQFYFELSRGAEPAEALRRAQARMAGDSRWSAPHLWAAFVVSGEPPALPADRRDLLFPSLGIALLLAAALVWRIGRRSAASSRETD